MPGNNSSTWRGVALSWGILGGLEIKRQKPRGLWLSVVVSGYQQPWMTCVNTHKLLPELFSGGVACNWVGCCIIGQISRLFGVENLLRQSSFPSIIRSIGFIKKNAKFSGILAIF